MNRFSFQIGLALFLLFNSLGAQAQEKIGLFEPADSFNAPRFWSITGTAAAGYTGVVVGLSQVWYTQYPRSNFHLFNDYGEWKDVDKYGHLFTAYFQSKLAMHAYRWAGVSRPKSIWAGVATATLFQTTLEVLDGFSSKWGFSFADVGFNSVGVLVMAGQEWVWQEQRIVLKLSAHRPDYPEFPLQAYNSEATTTLRDRAADLYGKSLPELFLKEYNGITIWASLNISAFIKQENSRFPKWLNLAAGFGAENLYGGYSNSWEDEEGNIFVARESAFPRYKQYYLSPDIDFTRIPTRHRSLKFLFTVLNLIKIPAPALEINTLGKVKFHPLYF